jgi:hypothetical protein
VTGSNPYDVTRVPLADTQPPIPRRPVFITIALTLLWILLAMTALGSIAHLRSLENPGDAGSFGYIAYLAGMVLVPAFLLAKIAQARNWARIALLILYVLNLLLRIFLFVNDGQFTVSVAAWFMVPAFVASIAFMLLFLPRSGRWFATMRR